MKDNKESYNKTINDKIELNNDGLINNEKENFNKNNEINNSIDIMNPLSFELIHKVDLRHLSPGYNDFCKIIHVLSKKRLGLLSQNKLKIISLKSFKEIKIIQPNYNQLYSKRDILGNDFIDFKELKNQNIILWTSNVILIYDKEYNLIQKIDEIEHGNICERKDYDYGTTTYYNINSIYELTNGKLLSCNSYGLKFYEKNNNEYNLISTEKMEIDVHFAIETKQNLLILLQKHYDEIYSDMEGDDKYLISIYNIENKSLNIVFGTKVESIMGEFYRINFINNKKYLFMCYGKTMKIFDLEKNMKLVNIENADDLYGKYEYKCGNYERIMKEEKRISKVLTNYSNTLFFGRDSNGNLKLYIFENNTLNIYYNFKEKNIDTVIKLKNNDFIAYSSDYQLYRFTPIFSK